MEITASMVRDLRERTGAGLMDCKKALGASGGDMEAAIDHLRKQGLKSAEKKADREMGEGRVFAFVAPESRIGSLIAVTCETDFVAKTDDFVALLAGLAEQAAEAAPADVDALLAQPWKGGGGTVGERIKGTVGKLGENIQVARVQRYENRQGRVGSYVHHNDKVGVLASVTTEAGEEQAGAAIKLLCMHAAAMKPVAVDRSAVPQETIERERAIYMEEVKGKPDEIRDKIVAGKLDKFFQSHCLVDQPWFKDDSKTVAKAMEDALGKGTKVEAFVRFEVGS